MPQADFRAGDVDTGRLPLDGSYGQELEGSFDGQAFDGSGQIGLGLGARF
jgi:hypothetical protein